MTNDVSKIRMGITVAFVIVVLAIIADLCYVFWRRRRFQRQNLSGESDINNNNTTSNSSSNSSIPSKELLYFFCWKSQLSRIEPADGGARPVFHSATTHHGDPQDPIDLLKLQEMYGPSRVLFTIKEEEKEEETEHQQQHYFSDDQKSSIEKKKKKRVCLKNWLEDAKTETEEEQESPVMVVVNIDEEDLELETPFSTPCASPPYYTPVPSPSRHDDQVSVVEEEVLQTIDRNLTHTVTIEADV